MALVKLTDFRFWRVSTVLMGAEARALRYRRRLLASGLCRPVYSSATGVQVPAQMQRWVGLRDACASAPPRGRRSVYVAALRQVVGKEKEVVASKRTSETQNPADHPVFEKENIWTVPNVLSLGRIVLSPALGWLVLREDYQLAFTLLAIAAVSDVVDGQVARWFPGQASLLGSVLDPFADKCLVSILCVTLTIKGLIPLPLTALFLSRDILLIGASFYLRYTTLPHPRTWSRYWDIQRSTLQVNTLLQLLTVGLSLGAPLLNASHHPALQLLWLCTGVTTVVSGASYIVKMKGFKILRNNHSRHKQTGHINNNNNNNK